MKRINFILLGILSCLLLFLIGCQKDKDPGKGNISPLYGPPEYRTNK